MSCDRDEKIGSSCASKLTVTVNGCALDGRDNEADSLAWDRYASALF